jgi:hypothetical protein
MKAVEVTEKALFFVILCLESFRRAALHPLVIPSEVEESLASCEPPLFWRHGSPGVDRNISGVSNK